MTRSTLTREAAIAALFVAIAIAMTWPLAPNLSCAVADPGDPYINSWILDWVGRTLFSNPAGLFHANVFHPARYTLALSENLILPAALLAPLRLAGVTPIAAHNLALLAGFAFTGFAAYLLGRTLTGSTIAGVAAGVFHALVPFRFTHLPHVQHAFAGFLPLLLWALVLYLRRPDRRRAALFAAVFLATGLTNVHWFLFGAFACAATALLMTIAGFRDWKLLAIGTLVAGLCLLPVFYPYAAVAKLYGMERQWSEVVPQSAHLSDWLLNGFYSKRYAGWHDPTVNPERWLFPGILGVALAAFGLFRAQVGVRVTALLWIAIGVFGSLGLNGAFHTFLFESVPAFRSIRSPARWAAIAYVGLAILIAIAVATVARRSRVAALLVPLALLLELDAAPVPWHIDPAPTPRVYQWLRQQPRQPILELPMQPLDEYRYMLGATVHRQPTLNGISGFAPPDYVRIASMANDATIPTELLDELEASGCRLLVIHATPLGPHAAAARDFIQRAAAARRVRAVARFTEPDDDAWVFELGRSLPRNRGVDTFVASGNVPSPIPFGLIDAPASRSVVRGPLRVQGWALAADGLASVEIVLNNGTIRVPATLQRDAILSRLYPMYAHTALPRFSATIDHPGGLWTGSEMHVLITSRNGRQVRLPSRFFTWLPR